MNPEQRAKHLIEWFAEELPSVEFGAGLAVLIERDWPLAKKCAMKVVDTILEGNNLLRLPLSYWEEVKNQIKKQQYK